mgnify:CR=1 FL=1
MFSCVGEKELKGNKLPIRGCSSRESADFTFSKLGADDRGSDAAHVRIVKEPLW